VLFFKRYDVQHVISKNSKNKNALLFEKIEALEEMIFSKIEIMCTIIQRLSGRTNRYTLRTFSHRMFYLSNASERRDEDRKEGGTYVRSDLWGQHLTAFCSLLHQQRCYVGRQFRPFLPPSSSSPH